MNASTALIVIDVQATFDDPSWGLRNNPDAERNIARLLAEWRRLGAPLFHVQHRNVHPGGRFHPDSQGFRIKDEAQPLPSETVLSKTVNSAFIGTDLEHLLRANAVSDVVLCGLTTDHCVSTTTRMSANLGFTSVIAADATATFDRTGPDGRYWTAQEMHDSAIASLHGEFATALSTNDILCKVDT